MRICDENTPNNIPEKASRDFNGWNERFKEEIEETTKSRLNFRESRLNFSQSRLNFSQGQTSAFLNIFPENIFFQVSDLFPLIVNDLMTMP